MTQNTPQTEEVESPYCSICKGCGYIGCDGIIDFLEKHVIGKTNCLNESSFVQEIIEYVHPDLEHNEVIDIMERFYPELYQEENI